MPEGKILVIDDEEGTREYLSMMLEREGYGVTVAEDGKKALKETGTYLNVRVDSGGTSDMPEATELIFLRELVEAGKLKPVIDRRYT